MICLIVLEIKHDGRLIEWANGRYCSWPKNLSQAFSVPALLPLTGMLWPASMIYSSIGHESLDSVKLQVD